MFEYALITTASGMFLRLMLLQFQQTLPDQLIDARDEMEREPQGLYPSLRRALMNSARCNMRLTPRSANGR